MTHFAKLIVGFTSALALNPLAFAKAPTQVEIAEQYGAIAHAVYTDALQSAKVLQQEVSELIAKPTEQNLANARQAWKAARMPYMQSEVFRFGNGIVDEWEGQLNSWPLDEGLIDYVAEDYHYEMGNVGAQINIIANPTVQVGSTHLNFETITPELLAGLNELGGSEANVATGYHAVEFLLWGQDLHGTAAGAGERPASDYAQGKDCTHGHCERRAQYLAAVTQLLVQDLSYMADQWQAGQKDNYRAQLKANAKQTLQKMLFGMGSLSLGELAGERMKVALEASSTEDEHDCFSDNTHYAHYYNAKGINNLYYGHYQRIDGTELEGPSLRAFLQKQHPALAAKADAAFAKTEDALTTMVAAAQAQPAPMKFDQMIAEGNQRGAEIVTNAINALVKQTSIIEEIATAMGIGHINASHADLSH